MKLSIALCLTLINAGLNTQANGINNSGEIVNSGKIVGSYNGTGSIGSNTLLSTFDILGLIAVVTIIT